MRFYIRDVLWAMVVVGLVAALYKEKDALYKEKEQVEKEAVAAANLKIAFDILARFTAETGDWAIELEEQMLTIYPAKDRKHQKMGSTWSTPALPSQPLPREWSPESLERDDRFIWRNEESAQ
jgi:hypothetical protein